MTTRCSCEGRSVLSPHPRACTQGSRPPLAGHCGQGGESLLESPPPRDGKGQFCPGMDLRLVSTGPRISSVGSSVPCWQGRLPPGLVRPTWALGKVCGQAARHGDRQCLGVPALCLLTPSSCEGPALGRRVSRCWGPPPWRWFPVSAQRGVRACGRLRSQECPPQPHPPPASLPGPFVRAPGCHGNPAS